MCKASLTRLTAGFPGAFRPATLYLAFFFKKIDIDRTKRFHKQDSYLVSVKLQPT